ncbi:hypothetical protein RIR_jg32595.t1 [Rhizophagus irregularis DAOM 181602=DAOM 197198]|nr:hypothetical protein RIR_jg32595.t1 [Rhizophagus irregularis DAOM 181602=DAOM 197198]
MVKSFRIQNKLNYKNCDRLREKWNIWTSSDKFSYTKVTRWMGQKMICLDKIKEEEFDENEKEIIDIDSDSADELDELEDDELNNDLY